MRASWHLGRFLILAISILFFTQYTYANDNQLCLTQKLSTGAEVMLTINKEQLHVLKPVAVNLTITDPKGQPIPGALIYCSLYIPMFATGLNNPKLKADNEAGTYNGIFVFNHKGNWKADLTINLPDGTYNEMTFDIEGVKPSTI
ncbi:MAG: hypothetical protein C0615_10400 [Desulfuromonas sp.]|nr:MAG: hypothetical protein C0615_10400 [Desulfuromonas sp.]